MASEPKVPWSRQKIGVTMLASIASLVALGFLIARVSGLGIFSQRLTVTSYFDNAAGVEAGATVELEGVTIGTVKSVAIVTAPERRATPVRVVMKLDPRFQSSLHTDSTAALTRAGLMDDTVVDVDSRSAAGPMLQDGDELRPLNIADITSVKHAGMKSGDELQQIEGRLNSVTANIQAGKGSVGGFVANPELRNETKAALDGFQEFSAKVNSNQNTAGRLLNGSLGKDAALNDAMAKTSSISKDIQDGKGVVGKAMNDASFRANASLATTNVQSLLSDLNDGKGAIGTMTDPAFAKKLSATAVQMNALSSGISAGKGTLGKIATDDAVSAQLKQLGTETNAVVAGIRKDPKHYLTIKVRIF